MSRDNFYKIEKRIAEESTQAGKRVRGIEPPCAAWEAAVLPLNYTREEIFDFRFAIADCNRNKFARPNCCSVRCPQRILLACELSPLRQRTLQQRNLLQSLPRNHVVGRGTCIFVGGAYPARLICAQRPSRSHLW